MATIDFAQFSRYASPAEMRMFFERYGEGPVELSEVWRMGQPHWKFWYLYSLNPQAAREQVTSFMDVCELTLVAHFDKPLLFSDWVDRAIELRRIAATIPLQGGTGCWDLVGRIHHLAKAYEARQVGRLYAACWLASLAVSNVNTVERVCRMVDNLGVYLGYLGQYPPQN